MKKSLLIVLILTLNACCQKTNEIYFISYPEGMKLIEHILQEEAKGNVKITIQQKSPER